MRFIDGLVINRFTRMLNKLAGIFYPVGSGSKMKQIRQIKGYLSNFDEFST